MDKYEEWEKLRKETTPNIVKGIRSSCTTRVMYCIALAVHMVQRVGDATSRIAG